MLPTMTGLLPIRLARQSIHRRRATLARRRRLAPTSSRTLIPCTLIGNSDTSRCSISLARNRSARHRLDRSGGNSVWSNLVQSRTLAGLRQWTRGVRGRRRTGRRIGPRIAFRRGFAGLRRGSGRRRCRVCRRSGNGRRTGKRRRMADGVTDRFATGRIGRLLRERDRPAERERKCD